VSREELTVLLRGIVPTVRRAVSEGLVELAATVSALAARVQALEGLPPGKDGVNGQDGAPGPQGDRGADGRDGRDGKDGLAGKDGAPGPQGQKGVDGTDGIDAFDFEPTYDGERTFTFTWTKGDRVVTRAFQMPVVIYRGVWAEGRAYDAGDATTWGGATWTAVRATSARPGLASEDSRAWVLSSKAGRDGKPGKDGTNGTPGRDGKDYGAWPQRS
jgi:integrin beta 3